MQPTKRLALQTLMLALGLIFFTACGGGSSTDLENTPPELKLIGDENLTVELNSTYSDLGVEAVDEEDGDISSLVSVTGTVDTSQLGEYEVSYNVSDSSGLSATPVSRNILVVEPLRLIVDSTLIQDIAVISDPDGGADRPLGAVSSYGKKAHCVENEIMISSDDNRTISAFLKRWNAVLLETVVLDGVPNLHTVYVDPKNVPTVDLKSQIQSISDIAFGDIRFSSDNILKLYALVVLEKLTHNLDISMNWVMLNQSIRTGSTMEQNSSTYDDYTPDAFLWPYMRRGSIQDTGVTSAWQMLDLLSIDSMARIMVIDSGFLDIGDYTGTSYPAIGGWGEASTTGCDSVSCLWHGTMVSHVAAARPDNSLGIVGAAGPHGFLEPVQFSGFDLRGLARAFRMVLTAPLDGPPAVINISGSVDIPAPFNVGLNSILDRVFDWGLRLGVLVVAAAGNEGSDVDRTRRFFGIRYETSTVIPCETSSVICVGGLGWDSNQLARGSNYGSQMEGDSVDIYAPYEYWLPDITSGGIYNETITKGAGTSYSAPFVSGVIAMMHAVNPDLSAQSTVQCLLESAHQNDRIRIHSQGGNQRRVDAFASVVCARGNRLNFPLLEIDSPVDELTVPGRSDIILSAASMGKDGVPLSISWSSDIDGSLHRGSFSSGANTVYRDLSVGTHILTATVTDTDGRIATKSRTVTITNNLPTANILTPREGESFGISQAIYLSVSAEDIDAYPSMELDNAQIRWYIAGTDFTGTGSSIVIPAGELAIGTYTLTVVADDGTDTAEDSVNIAVTETIGASPIVSILSPSDTVIRTSTTDDEGRVYADVEFTGFGTDVEDGDFSGTATNGPMFWKAINERGNVSNICAPVFGINCRSFTQRFYLDNFSTGSNYIIILEVTDTDGNKATDTINLSLEYDLI